MSLTDRPLNEWLPLVIVFWLFVGRIKDLGVKDQAGEHCCFYLERVDVNILKSPQGLQRKILPCFAHQWFLYSVGHPTHLYVTPKTSLAGSLHGTFFTKNADFAQSLHFIMNKHTYKYKYTCTHSHRYVYTYIHIYLFVHSNQGTSHTDSILHSILPLRIIVFCKHASLIIHSFSQGPPTCRDSQVPGNSGTFTFIDTGMHHTNQESANTFLGRTRWWLFQDMQARQPLSLQHESGHRQYWDKWVWPCASKSSFLSPEIWILCNSSTSPNRILSVI